MVKVAFPVYTRGRSRHRQGERKEAVCENDTDDMQGYKRLEEEMDEADISVVKTSRLLFCYLLMSYSF